MKIENIETLLLQEMENVKGGLSGTCICRTGAGQSEESGGSCSCEVGAGQQFIKKDPPSTCECSSGAGI